MEYKVKKYGLMIVMFFSCGCVGGLGIEIEKTEKREMHEKIFEQMDEIFELFPSLN